MRLPVNKIVSSVAANSAAVGVCDLITKLTTCDSAAALATILGGATAPILVPAVALCGSEILRTRGERQPHAEFDAHCQAVIDQLRQLETNQDAAADQLNQLLNRNTFVWARLSGGDQKRFAQLVTGEVFKTLSQLNLATDEHIDNLLVYHETTLYQLDQLQQSVDDIAQTIREKYERSEQDLRGMIADRDQEIDRLKSALADAQAAAQAGDTDADRAVRLARATGDAELLQKTIARLARRERQRQLAQRQQEDAAYLAKAREVAEIAYLRGDIDEARYWVDEILALRPDDFDATNRLGNIAQLRGELDEADAHYRRALELAGDKKSWQAVALGHLGVIAKTRGDLDQAEKLHREALDIHRKLGELQGQAVALGNLGLIAQIRGDLDEAEKLHREALDIDRKLGGLQGQASDLGNLGIIAQIRGDLDEAEKLHREALNIDRKLGRIEGQGIQLTNLGIIVQIRGDLDQAEKLYREALDLHRKLGGLEVQAAALGNLGGIARTRGYLDEAEKFYRESLNVDRKLGRLEGQATSLGNLGAIAKTRGELDDAEKLHREALNIDRKLGGLEGQANQLANLGIIAKARGEPDEARRRWTESRGLYEQIGMPHRVEQLQGWLDSLDAEG
ncbi:MAG: tetratricopeptide repeat protein [Planctomycetota bacterium]